MFATRFAPSDILTVAGSRFARPHVFGLFSVTLISNPAGDQTPFYPLSTRHRTLSKFEKKKSELKIRFRFNVQKETTLLTLLRVLYVRKLSWEYVTQLKYFVSVSLCLSLQWHLYFVLRESGELTNLKPSNEAKQHLKSQQAQVERSSFFCYNILNNLLINLQDCNINRITCGPVCVTWLFTQPLSLATETRNKRFPSVVIG